MSRVVTFAAAFLLFVVQPLFARLLLPQVGGASGVWTAVMLGFQSLLLFGYLLAQRLARLRAVRVVLSVHFALALVATVLAFVARADRFAFPDAGTSEVAWILKQQAWLVGAAFALLASCSPVIQHAYAHALDGRGDAYRLYAASNLGSFFGLLSYPFVIERTLSVSQQLGLWRFGLLLWVLLLAAHFALFRSAVTAEEPSKMTVQSEASKKTDWLTVAKWAVYACLPSSLMLGVTSYATNDLAPIPFLWVAPLAAYLLGMVLAFSGRGPRSRVASGVAICALGVALALLSFAGLGIISVLLNVASSGVVAWALHLMLYRARPPESRLTTFYLWVAVGGGLGGFFNAVVAPLIFDRVFEYHAALLVALAVLLRPWVRQHKASHRGVRQLFRARTLLFVVAAIAAHAIFFGQSPDRRKVLLTGRSFYSSYKVLDDQDARARYFVHGSTIHGFTRYESPEKPTGYYVVGGPIDEVFEQASQRGARDVGIVGLGCGTLAGYYERFESLDFFEIDESIARLAADKSFFPYLAACAEKCAVAVGDGRLLLSRAHEAQYDVLVVDAYSSDAIPVHLVTREAIDVYARALRKNGELVFHISSHYVDLKSPLAALAYASDYVPLHKSVDASDFPKGTALRSSWVVFVAKPEMVAAYESLGWQRVGADDAAIWTDDYADVLSAYRSLW